jgi:hypothetical protein
LFRFLALLSSRLKEEIEEVGSFIAVKESELDSLRWVRETSTSGREVSS